MPRRPCLGTPGNPCSHLAPPGRNRCDLCRSAHERQRGTKQQRGYDNDYDAARAALHLETRPPCHWCGQPATTADHDPPLDEAGPHTRLVPACTSCNYGHRAARDQRSATHTEQHQPDEREIEPELHHDGDAEADQEP